MIEAGCLNVDVILTPHSVAYFEFELEKTGVRTIDTDRAIDTP